MRVLSFGYPYQVNRNYGQHSECADGETGPATGAKSNKGHHTGKRTDNEQYCGNIDRPVPDNARIKTLVQVVEFADSTAALPFHLAFAIGSVDGHNRARAGRSKCHLDLVRIVAVVGQRRAKR